MKKLSILIVLMLFFLCGQVAFAAGNQQERVGGEDRFDVAGGMATKGWVNGADTVFITNYLAFADALAAAPLAYKYNAPILLTESQHLTGKTKIQIEKLHPSKVIVIGGEGSVSQQVVDELKGINGVTDIKRVGGKDRFAVAASIASQLGSPDTAVIANGLGFADALSIAPFAARNGYPIILTGSNELPAESSKAIETGKYSKTIVVGGTGSVSNTILGKLPNPLRIDGKDRYEVAANVIRKLKLNADGAFIATGKTFADALTGSVVAAKENAPILLIGNGRDTQQPAIDIIKEKDIQNFVFLGGQGSISESDADVISNINKPTGPIVYLVPHADDETLSYSIDIRNQMAIGRPVYLVLFSEGEDSNAINILNGSWWCGIHNTFHDPISEHYLDGPLDIDEFGIARENEYFRAVKALGVPDGHVFTDIIPLSYLSNGNIQEIKPVIEKYLAMFPDAEFRTMSWYDGHPQHAAIGKTLKYMEDQGEISPFKTLYFVSIFTDRQEHADIPLNTIVERINQPEDLNYVNSAIKEYSKWDPEHGIYAIGYHSVLDQFNYLMSDYHTKFHY